MTALPVLHGLLRDGDAWPGVVLDGLEIAPDGALELERVPAVEPAWAAEPGPVAPSGLAVDCCCHVFVAAAGRLLRRGLDCGEVLVRPEPARLTGLACGPHGWLLAADPDGGSVLVYTVDLRLRAAWSGFAAPVSVAADPGRWIAVLDDERVLWLGVDGRMLDGFDAPGARSLAARGPDLYVATADGVLRPGGAPLLVGRPVSAVAVAGGVLAAALEDTGEIVRVELESGRRLGAVTGFRGPVAGLAVTADGALLVKPDGGETMLVARPRAAMVASGRVSAGPLDAGRENSWARAAVAAAAPAGTAVTLETFGSDDPRAAVAWSTAAAIDTRLAPARFLWLRVSLQGEGATPRLTGVHARTPGGDYLQHLPSVYSRDPTTAATVGALCGLAQSLLDDLEEEIADLAQLADPVTAPAGALLELAAWQAFEPPRRVIAEQRWEELRALLAELPSLEQGTPAGVARSVEIASGVRPRLFELFAERRIWLLGERSALGFDTALPGSAADGLVVGESRIAASGPEDEWGAALYDDTAHLFTASVLATEARGREAALRTALDAGKPAHTDYHLCLLHPRASVGMQARVGLDAYVAGDVRTLELDEHGRLDVDGWTAPDPVDAPARLGRGHLGAETRIA